MSPCSDVFPSVPDQLITVTFTDQPVEFLVDTGAQHSAVNSLFVLLQCSKETVLAVGMEGKSTSHSLCQPASISLGHLMNICLCNLQNCLLISWD